MKESNITYLATASTDLPASHQEKSTDHFAQGIAIVTSVQHALAVRVELNHQEYNVTGYLSPIVGMAPSAAIGDKVLVSLTDQGALIHGVITPVGTPIRASFGFVDDKLVIEAQGAVLLKSGHASIEMSESGAIRIDGKNVRTVAKQALTFLSSKIKLN